MNIPRSAEAVTPMHPDKLCDRISDAILDECLRQDPESRVAVETMGGHGIITITGEVTTKAFFDARKIAQRIAGPQYGVQVNIVPQSPEISTGVDKEQGAGDQGIMVGYACNDNEAMIPQELYLARSLEEFLSIKYPYDGKTQIVIDKNGDVEIAVASYQNANQRDLEDAVMDWVLLNKVATTPNSTKFGGLNVLANYAGDWKVGGFEADTGVTGRKLMVDNYGPQVAIGGGAFSGKDASKVDRSAAYMARWIAKQLIHKTNYKDVTVKIAYVIGRAEPLMATAEFRKEVDGKLEVVKTVDVKSLGFDLTPAGIIKRFELKKPQFEKTAQRGHFGHSEFPWEKI